MRWLVFVVIPGLLSCADAERQARRDGAFDIAGSWADDDAGVSVVIANETDKNDVVVTLDRVAPAADEAPLLALLDDDRIALQLVLGAGIDLLRDEVDGGENVSFDDGAHSSVGVTGEDIVVEAGPDSDDARLRWSLHLEGDAEALAGELRLSLRENLKRPADLDGFSLESRQVASAVTLAKR